MKALRRFMRGLMSALFVLLLFPQESRGRLGGSPFEAGKPMGAFLLTSAPEGEYMPLPSIKVQRIRIHTASAKLGEFRNYMIYAVILTLGAYPGRDRDIKEAYLHTLSLGEAAAVVQDLKSGRVRGLWVLPAVFDQDKRWGRITGLDY